jgi:hypothetical protein
VEDDEGQEWLGQPAEKSHALPKYQKLVNPQTSNILFYFYFWLVNLFLKSCSKVANH